MHVVWLLIVAVTIGHMKLTPTLPRYENDRGSIKGVVVINGSELLTIA